MATVIYNIDFARNRVYNEKQGGGNENFNRLYPVYLFKFMAINNYFNRGFCGLEVMGEKK